MMSFPMSVDITKPTIGVNYTAPEMYIFLLNGVRVFVTDYIACGRVVPERIAASVENVREVVNELRVAPTSSLSARNNDAYISSKIKTRFLDRTDFHVQHVKVVTEAQTVYLMGLVTRKEADAATQIARTTQGVNKVVRVFEIISDEEATRLDSATGGSNENPVKSPNPRS